MSNKILLADDSITIQKVVNLTFTDEGINVVTVGNGELALKKLGEEHFDIVLADIFMPGRNGYEVCEFIKTSPQFGDIPVLLLVGAFEPFDKSEASRVRADGHLTKPFESRMLIETVKRMLAESAVRKAAKAPPPEPEARSAYQGHVVGWDVPTARIPDQSEEPEPEVVSASLYDPYASTAKLPAVEVEAAREAARAAQYEAEDSTMRLGSPASVEAAFAPAAPEPVQLESPAPEAAPFDLVPEGPAPEVAHAIEGPPDSVAGFSYDVESGPLPDMEPPADQEYSEPWEQSDTAEQPVSYQSIPATDSPLDLPDMKVVDPPRAEPRGAGGRDPLLETFADVAESTIRVDAPPTPGLEVTAHGDEPAAMEVGPTEGVTSAWDREAEGARRAEPPAPEAEAVAEAQTMSFSLAEAPFAAVDEAAEAAETEASAETPAEPAAPPEWVAEVEPAAEGAGDESESTPTKLLAPSEFPSAAGRGEADAPSEPAYEEAASEGAAAWEAAVEAAEPAPEPAVEARGETAAAEEVAAGEPAAEPVPANGSGAHAGGAIPPELIDEVVRRTLERMSDDVIREIAWEVVPELAERLIRKRLGEG